MPIKFRCQHCRQFLGISRSKAGAVVDCPTCGRSLRVPQLDGRIAPLSKPKLNLKDSSLADALNELAQLNQEKSSDEPGQSAEEIVAGSEKPASEEVAEQSLSNQKILTDEPTQAKQVIKEIPPVLQPVVIEMDPLPAPDPIDFQAEGPLHENSLEQDFDKPVELSEAVEVLAPRADAASEPAADAKSEPEETAKSHRNFLPKQITRDSWLLAIYSAATGLLVGMLIGWLAWHQVEGKPSIQGENNVGQVENSDQTANLTIVEDNLVLAVSGRVTYKRKDSTIRPDEGARVLVLPESRAGESKLSIIGFRGGDSKPDFHVVQAALRALGGNAAIVDKQGEYEIALPKAGTFHLLVISHYQSRDENHRIESELRGLLRAYFDRPEQLLGQVAYQFDKFTFNGTDKELRDVTLGVD